MNRNKISASIDIETTGLQAGTHEIVELAVITIENEKPKDSFVTNIRPMRPELAEPKALAINNLSLEELKKAPTPQQVRNTFFSWHEEVTGNSLLTPLGHNYLFDNKFLVIFFGDYYNSIFHYHYDDTMILARALKKKGYLKIKSCSLTSLCKFFNIKTKAHTAEGDALAVIQLHNQLLQLF